MVEWEGAERPAAVFRWSQKKALIGLIAVLAIGALGIDGLASSPDDPFLEVISGFLVLLAAGSILGVVASFRGQTYVALLREGILQRELTGWTFVPWESIEAVMHYHNYSGTGLRLRTTEPPRASGVLGVMIRFNRRHRPLTGGWDIGFWLWPFNHPEELVELVKRCVVEPDVRALLGETRRTS
jgi:hypothetical protein